MMAERGTVLASSTGGLRPEDHPTPVVQVIVRWVPALRAEDSSNRLLKEVHLRRWTAGALAAA
jgi:hypothetical protein